MTKHATSAATFRERIGRARAEMASAGVDALLLSVGRDTPYLIGYDAMPLERLTALVVRRDGPCVLVVPGLEAPRVAHHADVFDLVAWGETQDPMTIVVEALAGARTVAVGDQMWARFVLDAQRRLPGVTWSAASALGAGAGVLPPQAAVARVSSRASVRRTDMADLPHLERWNTILPSKMVAATARSSRAEGGAATMSRVSTTRSASMPGASAPLRCSSNDA